MRCLNGLDSDDSDSSNTSSHVSVSEEEKDAIGEVSNISMGTAATTLYSLVNQKVLITTPKVKRFSGKSLLNNMKHHVLQFKLFIKRD